MEAGTEHGFPAQYRSKGVHNPAVSGRIGVDNRSDRRSLCFRQRPVQLLQALGLVTTSRLMSTAETMAEIARRIARNDQPSEALTALFRE